MVLRDVQFCNPDVRCPALNAACWRKPELAETSICFSRSGKSRASPWRVDWPGMAFGYLLLATITIALQVPRPFGW